MFLLNLQTKHMNMTDNKQPHRFQLQKAVRYPKNKDMYSTWQVKLPLIFSLANALFLLLYGLAGLFFKDAITAFLQGDTLAPYFYFWKENLLFFFGANMLYYVFLSLLAALMIYACLLIWNGHGTGVNLYALGRVGSLIIPLLFFGMRGLSIGDIMLGVLFIAYYYLYMFRHLTNEATAPQNEKEK